MNEMKLRPPHEHCERCGNHMPMGATATMVWQKVPVTIYDCFCITDYMPVPVCTSCVTPAEAACRRLEFVCGGCTRTLSIPWTYDTPAQWRHCSERCYRRAARRNARHKQCDCVMCGFAFTTTRRDAQYCSTACRQRHHRQKPAA
jgi:hypothetical protein